MQVKLDEVEKVEDDPIEDIPKIIKQQREYFRSGETRDIDFRKKYLKRLKETLIEYEDEIVEAIHKDMGRPEFEGWTVEVGLVSDEIKLAIKKLDKWAKPRKVSTGLALFKSSAYVHPTPKGVTLIVGAWNYPFYLIFLPLISSLTAGNTAIVKPSELAVHSANLIEEIVAKVFPAEYVTTVQGGVKVGKALLEQEYDHILFTGSERVGRIYAKAAAENLTPITLELGGKSPTIVHKSADLEMSAERIAFAKWVNAGQTCVAPDYIIAESSIKDELEQLISDKIKEFYGDNPENSDDFGRIVNSAHFNRLSEMLEEVKNHVSTGGKTDEDNRFIEPTLIDKPDLSTKIMNEEIFGPLLPILTFDNIDDIKQLIERNPNPLALYIFASDKQFRKEVMQNIQSGDVAINDAALHFAVKGLPVGGIKGSGMGIYRGKYGFETFSHMRSVFKRAKFPYINLLKPPYTKLKDKLTKFFLK